MMSRIRASLDRILVVTSESPEQGLARQIRDAGNIRR